jgi:hypothetical protein
MKLPVIPQSTKLDIMILCGIGSLSAGCGIEFGAGYAFIVGGICFTALAIAEKLSTGNE